MAGRGAYQKKAQNIENVHARHKLLIEGINRPTTVDNTVFASLAGQRAFAALELPKRKITPIALNTLKSLANELFTNPDEDGHTGFAYIDALRIRLGRSISEAVATRNVEARAERASDKINILETRLAAVEAQNIKQQKAYLSLYSTINGLIKNGDLQAEAQERLYRVLDNHHAAFADLFRPDNSKSTGNEKNVTNLHRPDEPE